MFSDESSLTPGRKVDSSGGRRGAPGWLLAAALFGLLGYFTVYDFHRLSVGHYGDFPTFYQTANAIRDGRDPYQRWSDQYYVYPPLFAVLVLPLTRLSELHAARLYLSAHVAFMIGGLLLGTKLALERLELPHGWQSVCATALLVTVLMQSEVRGELQMLETDALILLMFVLGLWWLDRQPLSAGAALAFAFSIKYLTILALPYLLLRRRWKAAGSMLVAIAGFALLPALVLGWRENLRCLGVALGGLTGRMTNGAGGTEEAHVHHLTDAINISITSALARIARHVTHCSDSAADRVGLLLACLLGIGCVILVVILYKRHAMPMWRWPSAEAQEAAPFRALLALEWAGLMVATLALSPGTNMRQLVIGALPLAIMAGFIIHPRPNSSLAILRISVMALAIGFLLPIEMFMSRRASHLWLDGGVACWCLLGAYFPALSAGLGWVRTEHSK